MFAAFAIFISPITHRAISLTSALILLFLLIPPTKKGHSGVSWLNILFILCGVVPLGFMAIFADQIIRYSVIGTLDIKATIFAFVLMVVVLEACRRATGSIVLPTLLLVVLLATIFGNYMPGVLHSNGLTLSETGFVLYIGSNGFFGIPLSVAATIIIMFLIFSQVLGETGGSKWFIDCALSLVGNMTGGAAKVAVLASALFGTISGSPSGNAASIGTITIPLMKSVGYSPEFAGGVEATASTGGQIMPPVMGAVAFIIAEWLEISYIDVCLAAMIPAILYFAVLFYGVDNESRKKNLRGIPGQEIPKLWQVLKEGWFYPLPLLILLYFLVFAQFPPEMAAFLSTLSMFVLSVFIDKEKKRLGLPSLQEAGIRVKKVVLSIGNGVQLWVRVAAICAAVGILIGSLTHSGVALKIASSIIAFSGENLILVLLLAAVAAYILGMGMDTLPLYITLAILIAPALIRMGVPPIAAHLFILFWGETSFITPPVCLAVYITSSIAQSSIWKTGFQAMRLGMVIFIVPFAFVYYPSLLLHGSLGGLPIALVKTILATASIFGGVSGFFIGKITWITRIMLLIGGLGIMMTNWQINIAGLLVLLVAVLRQWLTIRALNKQKGGTSP